MNMQNAAEIESGARFAFGANWLRFLATLTDDQVAHAVRSLQDSLGVESLADKTFLDAGCGSGLFSLAARQLGARVLSFDYDPQSVECTRALKHRYLPRDSGWTIEQGSALDADYLAALGRFDVVYSWGVLHHTGHMYDAFGKIVATVAPRGRLFIAIYNDQGWPSRYWLVVKRQYNRGRGRAAAMVLLHAPYLFGARFLARAVTGRLSLERGMSLWVDMIDWLGGYPCEVAKPEAVFGFFSQRGFVLENLRTCRGRMGCNEFVFRNSRAD